MRLVDSSAWIEWIAGGPLQDRIDGLLPERAEWLVPTIVQYELSKWLLVNEPENDRGQRLLAFSTRCVVAPLTSEIAFAASHIGREHRLAMADAIVYATALAFDADIVTCDAHFEGLPAVIYLAKQSD
jgi:predicted nucleic acid-binding protein